MQKSEGRIWLRQIEWLILLFTIVIMLLCVVPVKAYAESDKIEVTGKVYEFDKDSHYEFQEAETSEQTDGENTYGKFCVSGNAISDGTKSGVPSYEVPEDGLQLFYDYQDTKLNANEDEWHLIDDKSDQIGAIELDADIMKGTILVQTSMDQMNWVDMQKIYNAFSDTPIRANSIYDATDVELINGCYYRIIIAYELRIRTEDSNFLFVNTDKYDYKKVAEVYEFYAYTNSGDNYVVDPTLTYNLGKKIRVENFDGYFGEELIKQDDPHYGWELGNFFVTGYTDEITNQNGNIVFLKNVGDKITLWFSLDQNINGLNGNEKLSITADNEGYDQYFETPKMNFGRGVLIMRYTDYNNVMADPIIYTNYLEANTSFGADTKVQLFEEGDYEVTLDYEVTSDELIDKIGHYRIPFTFSVRNGNCMIYPFEVETGKELTNSTMTENGFYLDLAKSRYLKINIKREVLRDSADGLVEDTRFNGAAKEGTEYTEDGIYTITVSNDYTGQLTTKKIYVGTNNILRAHMKTGLPISEINNLVSEGATIFEDGSIQLAVEEPAVEPEEIEQPLTEAFETDEPEIPSTPAEPAETEPQSEAPAHSIFPVAGIAAIGIAILIVIGILVRKRRTKNRDENDVHDHLGGNEQ